MTTLFHVVRSRSASPMPWAVTEGEWFRHPWRPLKKVWRTNRVLARFATRAEAQAMRRVAREMAAAKEQQP